MSTPTEPQQLTEGQVVGELRHALQGLTVVVDNLRRGDLEEMEAVKSLLADLHPLYLSLMNDIGRLEAKDRELTKKDRLFNRVTDMEFGNGWAGWGA